MFKDLLYVWPFVISFLPAVFPPDLLSQERCLQLTEKLGSFQDVCVALQLFEPANLDAVAEAEKPVLELLRQYGAKIKEELKNDLAHQLVLLRTEWQEKEPSLASLVMR